MLMLRSPPERVAVLPLFLPISERASMSIFWSPTIFDMLMVIAKLILGFVKTTIRLISQKELTSRALAFSVEVECLWDNFALALVFISPTDVAEEVGDSLSLILDKALEFREADSHCGFDLPSGL